MINIVVKFLEAILSLAAVLIVGGFGIAGFAVSYSKSSDVVLAIIVAGLGLVVGFVVAATTLGIPMLLLQINRNLESINSRLDARPNLRASNPRASIPTPDQRTEPSL